MDVQYTQVGPTRYAWRRQGSGPALLLIHGFPLSGLTWRKVLPLLSQHFTCYVPDLPGFGVTEWTDQTDFTWAGQTRGLKGLVDALGLTRYSILSQDTGGTLARQLALLDPARVEKQVLLNTEMPGHRPPWIPLYQALLRVPGTLAGFGISLRSRAFLRSPLGFGGCFTDLSLIDGEFRELFVAPLLRERRRLEGVRRYLTALEWDVVDGLREAHAKLAMPVRLVWGADDPTFPVALARDMARQLPQGSIREIPRAKLLVHEERPDEVARAVVEFQRA